MVFNKILESRNKISASEKHDSTGILKLEKLFSITHSSLSKEDWNIVKVSLYHLPATHIKEEVLHELYEEIENNQSLNRCNVGVNELLKLDLQIEEVRQLSQDISLKYKTDGNISYNKLVINPLFKIIKLLFPVYKESLHVALKHIGSYCVLVYKNGEGEIQITEISLLLAEMMRLLCKKTLSYHDAILLATNNLCKNGDTCITLTRDIIIKGEHIFEKMLKEGLILGYDY